MASPKTPTRQNQTNKGNTIKRPHSEVSPDSDTNSVNDGRNTDSWPRFLVIESIDSDRPLSKLSPFVIEKAMKGISGEVVSIKKLRSGSLIVEVLRAGQARHLLGQTSFASLPVKVTPHRSLNTSKGVIRNYELAQMEPSELLSELQEAGLPVVQTRNITQTRNNEKKKTTAIILTFSTPVLPISIHAGFLNIKVEPFIPNPLRCFNCQGFGHHQSICKKQGICPKCSQPAHGEDPCVVPIKCPNCHGDHPAYAASCPKWAQEKEICRVKTLSNISFPEARMQVTGNTQSNNRPLYSNIVRSVKSVSVATQTEVINCTCQPQNIVEPSRQTKKDHVKFRTLNTQTDEDGEEPSEGFKTLLGRLRPQSASPVGKKGKAAARRQSAKPPDRPVEGSQGAGASGKASAMDNTEVEALGSGYSSQRSGSRSSQGPRQKIGYPS